MPVRIFDVAMIDTDDGGCVDGGCDDRQRGGASQVGQDYSIIEVDLCFCFRDDFLNVYKVFWGRCMHIKSSFLDVDVCISFEFFKFPFRDDSLADHHLISQCRRPRPRASSMR